MLMRNCNHLQGEAWLSLMPTDTRRYRNSLDHRDPVSFRCMCDSCLHWILWYQSVSLYALSVSFPPDPELQSDGNIKFSALSPL